MSDEHWELAKVIMEALLPVVFITITGVRIVPLTGLYTLPRLHRLGLADNDLSTAYSALYRNTSLYRNTGLPP
jgi:hypothetical protein